MLSRMRTLRGFLISSILFYICLYLADALTYTTQLGYFNFAPTAEEVEQFFLNLFFAPDSGDPNAFVNNLVHVVEAIIWTLLLFYIIIPIVLYPFTVIAPIAVNYRDTKELRFIRYLILCALLFVLPLIIMFISSLLSFSIVKFLHTLGDIFDFLSPFTGLEISEITNLPYIHNSNSRMKFRYAVFINNILPNIAGLLFILSCVFIYKFHRALFRASPFLAYLVRFFDSGRQGLGGMSRFSNLVEEAAQRFTHKGNAIFLGNSLFIPWMPVGPKDDRHMLTIAGSRSGKGVTSIIPNLLAWQGSFLCIDPKGTSYFVTAKHRRTMGDVKLIDPFDVCAERSGGVKDGFNPLAHIDPNDPMALDQIKKIASALVVVDSQSNKFFYDEARTMLVGYIAFVVANRTTFKDASLVHVYDMIMLKSEEEQDKLHAAMAADTSPLAPVMISTANRALKGLKSGSKEYASVESTLKKQLDWIHSAPMQDFLTNHTIDFRELRKQKIAVYLILEGEYMETYNRLQRLVINSALQDFTKGGRSPMPCLFLFDEAATIGYMEEIPMAYNLRSGQNLCIWTIWQNMGDIYRIYGDAVSAFTGNCRAIQMYAMSGKHDIELLNRFMGQRRLMGKLGIDGLTAPQVNFREPNEMIMEVSRDTWLSYVLIEGKPVSLLRRVKYFESAYWYRLADTDPDYPDTPPPRLLRLMQYPLIARIINAYQAYSKDIRAEYQRQDKIIEGWKTEYGWLNSVQKLWAHKFNILRLYVEYYQRNRNKQKARKEARRNRFAPVERKEPRISSDDE